MKPTTSVPTSIDRRRTRTRRRGTCWCRTRRRSRASSRHRRRAPDQEGFPSGTLLGAHPNVEPKRALTPDISHLYPSFGQQFRGVPGPRPRQGALLIAVRRLLPSRACRLNGWSWLLSGQLSLGGEAAIEGDLEGVEWSLPARGPPPAGRVQDSWSSRNSSVAASSLGAVQTGLRVLAICSQSCRVVYRNEFRRGGRGPR